jgi:hypothetical protein
VSKVVSLNNSEIRTQEPDPHVVELAKNILARAEAGEIVGLAAVALGNDESTWSFRAGRQNASLIGRLESMKMRIMGEWD